MQADSATKGLIIIGRHEKTSHHVENKRRIPIDCSFQNGSFVQTSIPVNGSKKLQLASRCGYKVSVDWNLLSFQPLLFLKLLHFYRYSLPRIRLQNQITLQMRNNMSTNTIYWFSPACQTQRTSPSTKFTSYLSKKGSVDHRKDDIIKTTFFLKKKKKTELLETIMICPFFHMDQETKKKTLWM